MRTVEVAKAIAYGIQVFGWGLFSSPIIDLVKECALSEGESFAELAKQLISMGIEDAGAMRLHLRFLSLLSRSLPGINLRQSYLNILKLKIS